jgi:membrane dipeptidase
MSLIPAEAVYAVLAVAVPSGLVAILCVAAHIVRSSRSMSSVVASSLLVAVAFRSVFSMLPEFIEGHVNNTSFPLPSLYQELADDNNLSHALSAADLHADTLLWLGRDMLVRGRVGHADIPRLQEGNVRIFVFALVVSVPRGLNIYTNAEPRPSNWRKDQLFPKLILESWPVRSWTNCFERALFQCNRLAQVANISDGRLSVVRVSEDIDEPGDHTRGLLALEGASGLENATGLGSLASLHTLYKSGLRILGPTHFFDTCVGGSLSGVEKGGLSEFGFEVVATMKFLSMIVDVAHASVRVIADLASLPAESRTYVMFLDCPPNASLQSPVLEFLYQF